MRLYTKFILLIGAVTLGLGLSSSFLASRMMHKAIHRQLHDQAVLAAQTLAEHITHDVINGEVVPAHEAVMEIKNRLETIEYVCVLDFDGRVFAHTFEGGFPKAFAFRLQKHAPFSSTEPEIVEYATDMGRILDVAVPLIKGMAAHIHIGMSEVQSQAQIVSLRNRIMGLSLVLAVVGIAIGAIVSRRLTSPLAQMAGSMRDFGEHKREKEIAFGGGGREIADLTHAFNRMISDRKQAEETVQESETRYRELIDNMSSGVAVYESVENGRDFIFKDLNLAGERIDRRKKEDVVGKKLTEMFPGVEEFGLLDVFRRVYKTGQPEHHPVAMYKDDRYFAWFDNYVYKLPSGEIVAVHDDVTERKQAEQQREKLMVTVKAQNQQLTASEQQLRASSQQTNALNQQLIASQQELSLKNEELQSIVYISSHDLKTPLININGFSELLTEHCDEMKELVEKCDTDADTKKEITSLLNDDIPTDLDYIRTSTERMKRLIGGLLQVSRIGTVEIETQNINMNDLLSEIIDTVKYKTQNLNAEIILEKLPECTGDKHQIAQVFTNLVDNALNYLSPDRKGRIKITGKIKNKENIYCIEDNGIGIKEAYHGKVFEIYHRLDPRASTEGDGLGLTIVRRILDRHKGRIWLDSKPEKGTKFFVAIPTK